MGSLPTFFLDAPPGDGPPRLAEGEAEHARRVMDKYGFKFNWEVAKSWVLGFYGKITSIEYENDDPGDPDYYLYDADEFGPGLNILYTF